MSPTVQTFLESNYCLAIITHCPLDGNPCEAEPIGGTLVPPPPRSMTGPLRLLFTASHRFTEKGFFYHGGVDVLCAFLDLAEGIWCAGESLLLPLQPGAGG